MIVAVVAFLSGYLTQPLLSAWQPNVLLSFPLAPAKLGTHARVATQPTAEPTFSAAYLAYNVEEYPTFNVYKKRDVWEQAIKGMPLVEDFERDAADYGDIAFPYLTGNEIVLDGHAYARIIPVSELAGSGNKLVVADTGDGLTLRFTNEQGVHAFGFDYRANGVSRLRVNDIEVLLPAGRSSFVGIMFHSPSSAQQFAVTSGSWKGGIELDNIAFVPAEQGN